MVTARIGIVGGGLSGLYAATLLEERRVEDSVLLEVQETLGGRVLSVAPSLGAHGGGLEARPGGPSRHDGGARCPRAHPCVATPADQVAASHHAAAPEACIPAGVWRNRLIGIASGWSPAFPGYIAGALDAATRGVAAALAAPNP
ncbi:NAD(P)-binding protein [Archangium gephyra]|uniref:NAD(P)-binding protein n=1 Tax=Archangium gephyra TaxID=48 RepID=UPI0035D463B6